MRFKEILQNDVHDVFINADEFAEEHVIDGERMKAVLQAEEIAEFEPSMDGITNGNTRGRAKGMFSVVMKLYAALSDLGEPIAGSILTVDNEQYLVDSSAVYGGVVCVTIEEYGGR